MTWTRLDDAWTDSPQLAELSFQTRWHYLALIQFCSRTDRLDGVLRIADARRCSDVDDPSAALAELEAAGLITVLNGGQVKVADIDKHVPPPHVRRNAEQSKVRMRRKRKHDSGDHSDCLPGRCPQVTVTSDVTRNTGTGRDGTGRALYKQPENSETFENQDQHDYTTWEVAPIPKDPEPTCNMCRLNDGLHVPAVKGTGYCATHLQDLGGAAVRRVA